MHDTNSQTFRKVPITIGIVDPGISVMISNDLLVYTQIGGPIGTSGNTKALRVKHQLTDDYKTIGLSVEMDTRMWEIVTKGDPTADAFA